MKNLRSGKRFELHKSPRSAPDPSTPRSGTFYPFTDTSIRYFGTPQDFDDDGNPSDGVVSWSVDNFDKIQYIPGAIESGEFLADHLLGNWPFKAEGSSSPDDVHEAQSLAVTNGSNEPGLNILRSMEPIRPNANKLIRGANPQNVEGSPWISIEIQNEELVMPTDLIWERYPFQSPTRSIMQFDIPRSSLNVDEGDTVTSANIFLYAYKQPTWPGQVSCEVFLAHPETGRFPNWINRSGSAHQTELGPNFWDTNLLLPNPIPAEMDNHGTLGAFGGGSIMKLGGDDDYPVANDCVTFLIGDLSDHFEQNPDTPVEFKIDVTRLVQHALPAMPEGQDDDGNDLQGKLKFLLRTSYWPCPDSGPLPSPCPTYTVSPTDHPEPSPPEPSSTGPQFSGIIGGGVGNAGVLNNPIIVPGGGGSVFDSANNSPFSDGQPVQQNQVRRPLSGKSVRSTLHIDNDPRFLVNVFEYFRGQDGRGRRENERRGTPSGPSVIDPVIKPDDGGGIDPRPGGGGPGVSAIGNSPIIITHEDEPVHEDVHPSPHISPTDHGHPSPHEDNPPSPHISPSDHGHPSPSEITHTTPTATIQPTWPPDWCDYDFQFESMIGDEYSGPILKDRLYATYFYSREFKDVGNSPVSNYGTLTKVDFSNTGSNGVQFPDAYYDNIGSHHGIDVINNKFVSESGTHEIPGTSETVESVRGLPNVQFVIPTTNSDWQINYIDDENFSLTNRLNLIPGSASANQNATITIDDDYFFSGKNSEVFNLKGTYNIVQVSSAPVSIIPGAFGPSQGSEDDNRNIVVITIEQPATPFLGESTLGAQQYVSVMTYRDRVFLENVEQNHHPNQPVPTVDTDENPVFKSMTEDIVFTAFPKFIYKVDFSNDSNYGPGGDNENFRDIVTASSGLDSSFSTPGGEQKLRIKVTNTANGTRVSDADKIVVHLDQFMTQNQFADPALAYNIGDKIVMDYGVSRSIGEEVDNPAYGYTEGVTDFDTNNQGIYTITGFNLDANGNREVLVKDGEVTVNESRFDDTNTFGDGCTNIRRVNYLPRLEVNWTSATVPNYNGYVEGIIG